MAQKRRQNKRWVYWLVILVLLIAAGVVGYLVWDNYFREKKDDNAEASTEQVEKPVEKSEKTEVVIEVDGDESEVEDEKKVKQYEGEDPNKGERLTGAVTYAGVNGGKLMIRVNIDQYVESGTCSLGLRQAGASVYSATAAIVNGVSTATCGGFDVPVEELGSGEVVIVIYLSGDGKAGEINGEVRI